MILERGASRYEPQGSPASPVAVYTELMRIADALAHELRNRGVFLTAAEAADMRPAPTANDFWLVLETGKAYLQLTTSGRRRRVSCNVTLEDA